MNELAFLIIALGTLVLGCTYWLYWHTDQKLKFEQAADIFYSNIKPLINDPETPEEILDLLAFLNDHIDKARLPIRLFFYLLSHKFRLTSESENRDAELIFRFLERRRELRDPFASAVVGALVAMTYGTPIIGLLLRRLVLFDLRRHKERATEMATLLRGRDRTHATV